MARKLKPEAPAQDLTKTALVLRTCSANMTAYNGFRWPESGRVEAPDWSPQPHCGNGLHGLLWGVGNGELLSWADDAKWLVCEVPEHLLVEIDCKVKFPHCEVIYCGERGGAIDLLIARGAPQASMVCGTATAGYAGTATAGTRGTATAGTRGTATAGYAGTATAGIRGTATAGDAGTATAGDAGTATAGVKGTLVLRYWDANADRFRLRVGYVGEDGIKVGVQYKLDAAHNFVAVEPEAK